MATCFNENSGIQGELQTLVLMNPGYLYYPDTRQSSQQQQQSGNFVFLDSNNSGTGHIQANNHHQHVNISHAPPPPPPRAQYIYDPVELVAAPPTEATPFQQGLSLSLSRFRSQAARIPISPTGDDGITAAGGGDGGGGGGGSTSSASGMHNMLLNSKYLKATQQVLEEVVNVGKAAITNFKNVSNGDGGSPPPITGEPATKSGGGAEPTTAERQEIQMKKAKLVNMLDEVEQRYRQYHHQMQTVISWFEQVAGIGAAKTYTSLALQTISKQFRCLKDAILGQIKAASRSLGEDDGLGGGGTAEGGGSRLKFVDNQLRQQRALQQLGMTQHNAWRPQRGLPERSVSVLRAWLFEHFLHPYPKDSDKHILAKQTGLTRSQVSNWFINARVRLWKPMVEEMYLEETKEQEHNGTEDQKPNQNEQTELKSCTKPDEKNLSRENSTKEFTPRKPENPFINPPKPLMSVSTAVSASSPATGTNFQCPSGFSLLGTLEMNQYSPKKPRNNDGGFTIAGTNSDFMGGFGGYPIGDEFQQQCSRNGVSLNLSISGNHRNIFPNQNIQLGSRTELRDENNYGITTPASLSDSASMYDSMNIQNRKRFAAQLLPDFVA